MALREDECFLVRRVADRGIDKNISGSRARDRVQLSTRRFADRGSDKVGRDPWDLKIERLAKRLQDLEAWLPKETEPNGYVRDRVFGEKEHPYGTCNFNYDFPPVFDEYEDNEWYFWATGSVVEKFEEYESSAGMFDKFLETHVGMENDGDRKLLGKDLLDRKYQTSKSIMKDVLNFSSLILKDVKMGIRLKILQPSKTCYTLNTETMGVAISWNKPPFKGSPRIKEELIKLSLQFAKIKERDKSHIYVQVHYIIKEGNNLSYENKKIPNDIVCTNKDFIYSKMICGSGEISESKMEEYVGLQGEIITRMWLNLDRLKEVGALLVESKIFSYGVLVTKDNSSVFSGSIWIDQDDSKQERLDIPFDPGG